jgi:hypothetical protein
MKHVGLGRKWHSAVCDGKRFVPVRRTRSPSAVRPFSASRSTFRTCATCCISRLCTQMTLRSAWRIGSASVRWIEFEAIQASVVDLNCRSRAAPLSAVRATSAKPIEELTKYGRRGCITLRTRYTKTLLIHGAAVEKRIGPRIVEFAG